MADFETYRDHNGVERLLAYAAPEAEKLTLRASRNDIFSVTGKLFQQAEWKEVDLYTGHPIGLLENQGQEGACTCAATTGKVSRQIYLRTSEIVKFSWMWLYDQINGGRDRGSNIIDAMMVLLSQGLPPFASYPKSLWRPDQNPSGVPWFKAADSVTVGTSVECATGLMLGYYVEVPILVTNTFENFTGDGVAWGGVAPRSNSSNHAIYLVGLKFLKNLGKWFFVLMNSWGNWGPFKNGTCLIPIEAVENPSVANDGYCALSIINPADINKPAPSLAV